MAADLGLVAHAAERDADELPAERRARSTWRATSCPRRAARRSRGSGPFTAGFSFRTARYSRMRSLTFSRPECSASSTVLGAAARSMTSSVRFAHGKREQPVEVCPGRPCTRRRRAASSSSRSSSRRASFWTSLGHAGRFDLLAEFVDLLRLIVALAEFPLDRLQLLAQEVVALVLADLRLHLRLDLRAELQHFELLDQDAVQQIEARAHVERGRAPPA